MKNMEAVGYRKGLSTALDILMIIRQAAKKEKNWKLSDWIRDELQKSNFEIKDEKDGDYTISFNYHAEWVKDYYEEKRLRSLKVDRLFGKE